MIPSPDSVANAIQDAFGLRTEVGCEVEFHVVGGSPLDARTLDDWNRDLGRDHQLFNDVGLEAGFGQYEARTRPTTVLARLVEELRTIRERLGVLASMNGSSIDARSFPGHGQAGNALHINLRLLDSSGANILDSTAPGRTPFAAAINGLLDTMPLFTAVFAPSEACFSRYREAPFPAVAFVPSRVCWGPDNRAAALRLPPWLGQQQTQRIEHRVAGGSADPGEVLAAILIGIFLGLEEAAPLKHRRAYGAPNHPDQDFKKLPDFAQARAAFQSEGRSLLARFGSGKSLV